MCAPASGFVGQRGRRLREAGVAPPGDMRQQSKSKEVWARMGPAWAPAESGGGEEGIGMSGGRGKRGWSRAASDMAGILDMTGGEQDQGQSQGLGLGKGGPRRLAELEPALWRGVGTGCRDKAQMVSAERWLAHWLALQKGSERGCCLPARLPDIGCGLILVPESLGSCE